MQMYPGREVVRVSALPNALADEKAMPMGSLALRLDDVTKIASALHGVLVELVEASGGEDALREQCEVALRTAKLTPLLIRDSFMRSFGEASTKLK